MLAGDVAQVLGVQQSIPGAAQELGTGVAQVDLNAAGGGTGTGQTPPIKPFGIFHPPPLKPFGIFPSPPPPKPFGIFHPPPPPKLFGVSPRVGQPPPPPKTPPKTFWDVWDPPPQDTQIPPSQVPPHSPPHPPRGYEER